MFKIFHNKVLEKKSHKNLYTHVYSNIIHKTKIRKLHRYPQMDVSIHRLQHIHTIEYYSVLKTKEILMHSTRINPKDIWEISHKDDKHCMNPFAWSSQIHGGRKHNGGCQGAGRRGKTRELVSDEYWVSVLSTWFLNGAACIFLLSQEKFVL